MNLGVIYTRNVGFVFYRHELESICLQLRKVAQSYKHLCVTLCNFLELFITFYDPAHLFVAFLVLRLLTYTVLPSFVGKTLGRRDEIRQKTKQNVEMSVVAVSLETRHNLPA